MVRTRTQKRGRERLHDRTRMDARRSKGKRKTKDVLEKKCGKTAKQGRMGELECGQSGSTEQGGEGSLTAFQYAPSGAERFKEGKGFTSGLYLSYRPLVSQKNRTRNDFEMLLYLLAEKPCKHT